MVFDCLPLLKKYRSLHRRCFYSLVNVVLGTSLAVAQNLYTSFGPLSEISIGDANSGIFGNSQHTKNEFDFGVYGSRQITLVFCKTPSEVTIRTFRLTERIEKIVAADCNKDNRTDLILLTLQPTTLSVYLARGDTFHLQWSAELSVIPEKITVVDVNFDKKPDILVYGKKHLGVYVYFGIGNGTFRPAQSVLEEFSFSHLLFYDINNDKNMDALGYDWVQNELLLFSSIGPLRFAAPATFALSSELVDVALANINNDQYVDLAILYKEPEQLRIFHGDGLGGFSEAMEIRLSYVPKRILVRDVNDDRRNDVIVFSETDRCFHIYMNAEGSLSEFAIAYGAALTPIDISDSYSAQTASSKFGILDRQHKNLYIYHHYLRSFLNTLEQTYSLGLQPRSLISFDANRNGFPDLIVTNAYSEHISLFLNRGDGTFYGQFPLASVRGAESIYAFWKNASVFVCVTTHPAFNKIALSEVTYPNFDSKMTVFSAPPNIEVLSQSYDSSSQSLRMIVSSKEVEKYTMTEIIWPILGSESVLSLREEDIMEHTLFETPPGETVAIEFCDLNQDGIGDVLYIQRDVLSKNFFLFASLGIYNDTLSHRGKRKFQEPKSLVRLPNTNLQKAYIWCRDLNNDGVSDLILQYRSNNDYIGISLAKNDKSFTPVQEISSQVDINNRNDIAYIEVDGDNIKDLVVSNMLKKSIQVFSGRGEGKFSQPKRLLSFPSGGVFTVFDGNGDRIPDYAVLHTEPGVLKVFLGKE